MDEPEKDWNELQLWFLKTCWSKDVVTRDDSQRTTIFSATQRFNIVVTLLQHCYYIVSNGCNIVPAFEPCVALKIVVANSPV